MRAVIAVVSAAIGVGLTVAYVLPMYRDIAALLPK